MATARWNLVVSDRTDAALRTALAAQGRARKGELSRFVEEAVLARILEIEAAAAKQANAERDGSAIAAAVDEAVEWARRR
ncbi:MAG: ribbon-helix-helix domain-containing protein [Acetobacteraceae bacterium]|nr:ribbon-helix-helix domain-containing protein [Acetobacteraceae bacterium]